MRGVASIKSSSEEPGYESAMAVDGDPATFWHTTYSRYDVPRFPDDLVIQLSEQRKIFHINDVQHWSHEVA